MNAKLQGYVSCVCVAHSEIELEKISSFVYILETLHRDFEVIVCTSPGAIETGAIQNLCIKTPSLAVYEISTSTNDAMVTAGLELALGDWVMELPNAMSLEQDARNLMNCFDADSEKKADTYQLISDKPLSADRLLSFLASSALEVPVYTMMYVPRLSKRSVLQSWNSRKLRSKVLRVAPQLNRAVVQTLKVKSVPRDNTKRFIRIGLRTIAHSSAKPLRWVSFFSLIGAVLSVVISVAVLIVGINRKVVAGWTTTNLQISGLSFLILAVLGVLTEYIYQIAAASIDQPASRVTHEHMSPNYAFRKNLNISMKNEEQ